MNTLHNVGKQVSSFELYDQLDPITGIWLFVGEDRDEDLYKAGNETGTVLEVYCPYGDQTMANTLLSQLQGQVYAGFRAQNAVLSPAAELGDWVTVNGGTYMLAYRSINFGPGHMAEIAAPGESTQEHEYGWTSPETRKTTYNQTRSMISKTNKEIELAIYGEDGKGGLNGQLTAFRVSLGGLSTRIESYEKTVGGYTEEIANFRVQVDGLNAEMSRYTEELTGYKKETAQYAVELNGYSGKVGEYESTVNGYQNRVLEFQNTVNGFHQTVGQYTENMGVYTEEYTKISQTFKEIKLEASGSVGGTVSIQLKSGDTALGTPASINLSGLVTISSLGESGTTEIHGSRIKTGTIDAKSLNLYGDMSVREKKTSKDISGYIGYCEGWNPYTKDDPWEEGNQYPNVGIGVMNSKTTGQCVCSDGHACLSFGNHSGVQATADYLQLNGYTGIYFGLPKTGDFSPGDEPEAFSDYAVLNNSTFRCYSQRPLTLGEPENLWTMLYAKDCSCCASDANKKNSIEDLPDNYLALFDRLQPKRYKMNHGTSGRYHTGYIAQEVKAAMDEAGIDSSEFGGWIMANDEDGNPIYMLRYEEFGAIYAAKIKQLEARVAELEERL